MPKVFGRSYQLKTGTDIIYGSRHRCKVCGKIIAFYGDQQHREKEQGNEGDKINVGSTQNLMLHDFSFKSDLPDTLWMNIGMQLFYHCLKQDDKSGNLNAASGTACAGTDEHQKHQHCFTGLIPGIKVYRRKAGGGNNGGNLKTGIQQCAKCVDRRIHNIDEDKYNGRKDDQQIDSDFFHLKCIFHLPEQDQVLGIKIDTKENHKNGDNPLLIHGVAGKTVI